MGLNGPVEAVAPGPAGALFFAGAFDASADGPASVAPDSQRVAVDQAAIITQGNANATALACPAAPLGWLLPGPLGTIELRLPESAVVTGFALQNAPTGADGVRLFSIAAPAVSPGASYSLVPVDPSGSVGAPCTLCSLPKGAGLYHFFVDDPESSPPTNDIVLTVVQSHGSGPTGLSTLQVFRREIVVHANPAANPLRCPESPRPATVSLSGNWVAGSSQGAMRAVPPITTTTQATFAIFSPNLPVEAAYTVSINVPACGAAGSADPCAARGAVVAAVASPANDQPVRTVTVDARSTVDASFSLGTFLLAPGASINISSATLGTSITIESVSFEKVASIRNIKFLASLDTRNPAARFAPLAANTLPDGSAPRALAVDARGRLFVGGRFAFSSIFTNVARYAPRETSTGWAQLAGSGLNGPVSAMDALGSLVFVAGDFTGSTDGVSALRRLAIYDGEADRWLPMAGGVDAAPSRISVDPDAKLVRITGPFTRVFASQTDTQGAAIPAGVLVWSVDAAAFIEPPERVRGSLDVSISFTFESRQYVFDAGNITDFGIDRSAAGIALLSNTSYVPTPSVPANASVSALAWDASQARVFMAGVFPPLGPLPGPKRAALASINEDGSDFRLLGLTLDNGNINDMLYLPFFGQLILAGSFTGFTTANGSSSPATGILVINPDTFAVSPAMSMSSAPQSAIDIRQIYRLDQFRVLVLGSFTIPSGITGFSQDFEAGPNVRRTAKPAFGVAFLGGRFAVPGTQNKSSVLSLRLDTPSSLSMPASGIVSLEPLRVGPSILDVGGPVIALCLSLDGSLFIVSRRDTDGALQLAVFDGHSLRTRPLPPGSSVTGLTSQSWPASGSQPSLPQPVKMINGVMITGQFIMPDLSAAADQQQDTQQLATYAAILYDPVADSLIPFIGAVGGGFITTLRTRFAPDFKPVDGSPGAGAKGSSGGSSGFPVWGIVLIVISCLIFAAILGWLVYIAVRREIGSASNPGDTEAGSAGTLASACSLTGLGAAHRKRGSNGSDISFGTTSGRIASYHGSLAGSIGDGAAAAGTAGSTGSVAPGATAGSTAAPSLRTPQTPQQLLFGFFGRLAGGSASNALAPAAPAAGSSSNANGDSKPGARRWSGRSNDGQSAPDPAGHRARGGWGGLNLGFGLGLAGPAGGGDAGVGGGEATGSMTTAVTTASLSRSEMLTTIGCTTTVTARPSSTGTSPHGTLVPPVSPTTAGSAHIDMDSVILAAAASSRDAPTATSRPPTMPDGPCLPPIPATQPLFSPTPAAAGPTTAADASWCTSPTLARQRQLDTQIMQLREQVLLQQQDSSQPSPDATSPDPARAASPQPPRAHRPERLLSISTFDDGLSAWRRSSAATTQTATLDAAWASLAAEARLSTALAAPSAAGSRRSAVTDRVESWLLSPRVTVVARDSYQAQDSTELSFHGGDRIQVLDSTDPFWWTGRLETARGQIGLFPASLTARTSGELQD
ncbi:hypothetical protein HK105_203931 [Polyrhizophydium stewartii]|uniref:SH3 domain-containing protein n=1 Tax=Polyrhizophydium stewartii TaxID=2732419 RepID=A0ABR4NAE0_9FUNG